MRRTATMPLAAALWLQGKIDAQAGKAQRLGLVSPTITISDPYVLDGAEVVDVIVEGGAVRIPGWTFLAIVELGEENIVRALPEAEGLPVEWWTAKQCEHCHKQIERTRLIGVRNDETGKLMLVGTTCARDFLGHASPGQLIECAFSIDDLMAEASDEEQWESRGWTVLGWGPAEVLRVTAGVIAAYGWVPKSRASEGNPPTASIVAEVLTGGDWAEETRREVGESMPPSVDDEVAQALEWAASLPLLHSDDYIRNLGALARREIWGERDFGIGCSLLSAYRRHIANEAKKEADKKAREQASPAPIGKGILVEGVVINTDAKRTDFGTRWVFTVQADAGWRVWGTIPSAIDPSVGDRVRFLCDLEPSDSSFFAFAKRPRKAVIVEND